MELIIDDRERVVVEHLKTSPLLDKYKVTVERIEVGDYCVVQQGRPIVCIERKTWKDLASSIKDGRVENMNKMLALREQTGCRLLYLIEGSPFASPTKKIANIEFRNLQSHLDRCQFRDNIGVIYAKSTAEVLPRLAALIDHLQPLVPLVEEKETSGGDPSTRHLLKERRVKTDREKKVDTWCSIKDIGRQTAEVLVANGISIRATRRGEVTKEQLEQLTYPSGSSLGSRAATILANTLAADPVKILKSINRISATTAAAIVQANVDIFRASQVALAGVQVGKRRLGVAAAASIVESIS